MKKVTFICDGCGAEHDDPPLSLWMNRAGEKLGPKRVRALKQCVLCLLHNDDPSDPESQTYEQYLELRPGDDIVIVPGGDDLVEKEKTNHGRRVV